MLSGWVFVAQLWFHLNINVISDLYIYKKTIIRQLWEQSLMKSMRAAAQNIYSCEKLMRSVWDQIKISDSIAYFSTITNLSTVRDFSDTSEEMWNRSYFFQEKNWRGRRRVESSSLHFISLPSEILKRSCLWFLHSIWSCQRSRNQEKECLEKLWGLGRQIDELTHIQMNERRNDRERNTDRAMKLMKSWIYW